MNHAVIGLEQVKLNALQGNGFVGINKRGKLRMENY
jgi:hypothetical protein